MGQKIVTLDLKDKKLLYELDFNARLPYTVLGRHAGLSKQGAEYRVQRLLEKGVIKGFYSVIHMQRLGYVYCRMSVTLQHVTREKKQEMITYLREHQKVFWLFEMQGAFDLLFVVWAKSLREFKEFVDELFYRYGSHIKRVNETIATDVIHLQHRYLLEKQQSEELHLAETDMRANIDEIDQKILQMLCEDGRASLVEIAGRVKTSAKVVAYRIKRMEEQGLILAYRPILNHRLLGYTYYKVFLSLDTTEQQALRELQSYLKRHPAVIYVIEGLGFPKMLDFEMMVQSNQELFSFIEELRFRFPRLVGEYETVVFLDTLKVKYLPF